MKTMGPLRAPLSPNRRRLARTPPPRRLARQPRPPTTSTPSSTLLRKHHVPRSIAAQLGRIGVTTAQQLAHLASTPAELDEEVLIPAGMPQATDRERARLKTTARAAWRASLSTHAHSAPASAKPPSDPADAIDPDKRKLLLTEFTRRYGTHMDLDSQPSDKLLARVLRHKARRVAEFISLKDVYSAVSHQPAETEQRIAGTRIRFVSADDCVKAQTDFHLSSLYFLHSLRVLLHAYALAGCDDPLGKEWVAYPALLSHYRAVEKSLRVESRYGGRARHLALSCEKTTREEWHRYTSQEDLSLSSVIVAVADKLAPTWPTASHFKKENDDKAAAPHRAAKRGRSPTHHGRDRDHRPRGSPSAGPANLKVHLCRNHLNSRCSLRRGCPRSHSQQEQQAAIAARPPRSS